MTPTGGDTSSRNSLLITRLQLWALACPMAPCSAPMPRCCGRSAGRPSRRNSTAASRRRRAVPWAAAGAGWTLGGV